MKTVGDIRKAIASLSDELPVVVFVNSEHPYLDDHDLELDISVEGFGAGDDNDFLIYVRTDADYVVDQYEDEDEDEDDEDDDDVIELGPEAEASENDVITLGPKAEPTEIMPGVIQVPVDENLGENLHDLLGD